MHQQLKKFCSEQSSLDCTEMQASLVITKHCALSCSHCSLLLLMCTSCTFRDTCHGLTSKKKSSSKSYKLSTLKYLAFTLPTSTRQQEICGLSLRCMLTAIHSEYPTSRSFLTAGYLCLKELSKGQCICQALFCLWCSEIN